MNRHLSIMNVNTVQCSAGMHSLLTSLNEFPNLYISILASIFRASVCIFACVYTPVLCERVYLHV